MTEPTGGATAVGAAAGKAGSTGTGAAASSGTALIATGLVWLLGNIAHVKLTAEAGAGIAGALIIVVQFVWHVGLRNIWRHILDGDHVSALQMSFVRLAQHGL
jgi:hypothetical protein